MRFFRNLRVQSLDKNNINKYFRYAIGEIILVVVGILIAFSNQYSGIVQNDMAQSMNNITKL